MSVTFQGTSLVRLAVMILPDGANDVYAAIGVYGGSGSTTVRYRRPGSGVDIATATTSAAAEITGPHEIVCTGAEVIEVWGETSGAGVVGIYERWSAGGGEAGPQGPAGPAGPAGPTGPQGLPASVEVTVVGGPVLTGVLGSPTLVGVLDG